MLSAYVPHRKWSNLGEHRVRSAGRGGGRRGQDCREVRAVGRPGQQRRYATRDISRSLRGAAQEWPEERTTLSSPPRTCTICSTSIRSREFSHHQPKKQKLRIRTSFQCDGSEQGRYSSPREDEGVHRQRFFHRITPVHEQSEFSPFSVLSNVRNAQRDPGYAIAKAALDQLTTQLAGNLISKGIRVNSVK